jgi:uncharacterized membrane protein
MNPGIIFAIVAAIAFGVWTVFHDRAADHINYLFGAIIVSATAVIVGLIFLLPKIKTTALYSNPKGLLFAALAGLCALVIDFFALKAYGSGLSISVAGPIIIAGSVAIAAIIGFFLGESVTLLKIGGLLLVIIGSGILAAFS